MLSCSSFTQPERFLQTDQLIIRLQVVVVTNFIRHVDEKRVRERVQVRCSDLVWAAIFRTPSSMFDKLLHLSKFKRFAMSCSRSLSPCTFKSGPSFARGECIDSHPCVSRIPELLSCPCTEQSSQVSICTICPIGPLVAVPSQATNQCHQIGFTRTQTCSERRIHGIPRVFNRTFDPHCKFQNSCDGL